MYSACVSRASHVILRKYEYDHMCSFLPSETVLQIFNFSFFKIPFFTVSDLATTETVAEIKITWCSNHVAKNVLVAAKGVY